VKTSTNKSKTSGRTERAALPPADLLLEAVFKWGTLPYETEQLALGTPEEIAQKLAEVAKPRKEYDILEPYNHFIKLIAGISVAQEKLPASGLAEKLFARARWLFDNPGFDVHHIFGVGEDQILPVRKYVDAFLKYAPEELKKLIPVLVRHHCTDINFLQSFGKEMEAFLAKVPETKMDESAALIVKHMLQQKNYFRLFALSRYQLCELGSSRGPEGMAHLENYAAFFKQHATPEQERALVKKALASLREDGIESQVAEVLKKIFPNA
jgi:hypothetical protein